ncbi:hypothetical protein PGN35_004265 [Nodosilinea sp. PGN35]|uniref:hypothetical protein n=1 Tax=Nodosilinea sp. PGN35 TaxID=3020489 RepID=UPI0023B252B6|nr:hypothetical protein [Nodosilinea sp. TSF1-S3]MDF0365835.1 hypothetical protein [Nodosilinea sp. TSF1-S3]
MSKPALRLSALLPLGLALLLTTAACTRTPEAPTANDTAPPAGAVDPAPGDQVDDVQSLLALSGEGLQLVGDRTGSTTTLEFGSAIELVADAVTSILGEPLESGENSECGSGPQTITQWPRGLVLHAANGEFIGWSARPEPDAALTTMAGVGVGSSRSELDAAYTVEVFASTLGTEFSAGSLFGILSSPAPDAVIEHLWAGTTCNFR